MHKFKVQKINFPYWVHTDKKEEFSEYIDNLQADFFYRWNYKTANSGKSSPCVAKEILKKYRNKINQKSKHHVENYLLGKISRKTLDTKPIIEIEIIKNLQFLKQDYHILNTDIAKQMVNIHQIIENCLSPPSNKSWTTYNGRSLDSLCSRLEARGEDKFIKKQKIETQKYFISKNPYTDRKKIFEKQDRYAALLLWLVLDLYDQDIPITSNIFKKIDRSDKPKPPIKWAGLIKLTYRKICYLSKVNDLGVIQSFVKDWDKKNSNQKSEVSDSEFQLLGMACVIEISKMVKDFLEQKKELKDKFSAERWLHLKHGSSKWKVAD